MCPMSNKIPVFILGITVWNFIPCLIKFKSNSNSENILFFSLDLIVETILNFFYFDDFSANGFFTLTQ